MRWASRFWGLDSTPRLFTPQARLVAFGLILKLIPLDIGQTWRFAKGGLARDLSILLRSLGAWQWHSPRGSHFFDWGYLCPI
jgi:hypothetical protein